MHRLRLTLVVLAVLALAVWFFVPRGPRIERGSILTFDLSGHYVEAPGPSLIGRLLGGGRRPFVSVLSELAKAQRDDRLAGVVLRIRRLQIGWGMAQELRGAIEDLRKAGRPTLAYLETGALGANHEYYVASAADQVVVSPGTTTPVIGLSAEFFFLGGLWEKIGAGVETIGRGEYKSAAEILGGTKMSAPHREMATSLLDSTYAQFVHGIAEGRHLDEARVRELIDRAPATPQELQEVGLVDGIGPFDEAARRLGPGPLVKEEDYASVTPESVGFHPVARFALVYGSGTVSMGKGTTSPTGGMVLASDTVSEALTQAAKDPDIRAIVFRVDSPGGSPLAADIVWRAAEQAKAQHKPLVASVSDLAASGGYYVLCGADSVVAPPASLIGSIGVFVMRPEVGGLLAKLGIGVETMQRGTYADLLEIAKPLDDAGRERLRVEIGGIYDLFLSRVSAGRGLTVQRVDEVGRGRVWTGEQALANGLVDELGGLHAAVRRAKVAAGIDPDADVELVPYPKPKPLAEEIADTLRGASLRAARPLALPLPLDGIEPLLAALQRGGPLLVPPFAVDIH